MIQPLSTLRLQLHAGYTLEHAAADLPYFQRLGVSHLYLSPVTRAVPGSTHGYDVVDHTSVDEERGGEAAFRALAREARARGLGLLLDIVPNHMATHPNNAWWWDVLENGPSSQWAEWFDIDWHAPSMEGKVLAPFLAKPYEDALRAGDIRLLRIEGERGYQLAVHGVPYPVAPGTLSEEASSEQVLAAHDAGRPEGRQRLNELLERQHYRLTAWQRAALEINWRRFFEVSGLIGVRVEREEVFDAVHALPLKWYAEGLVDGLRVDHVDGLALPLSYCRRLRAAMARSTSQSSPDDMPPWVVVEKILAAGEVIDDRWAVDGTTGYDFAADVGGLLHAETGATALTERWNEVAGDTRPPEAWLVEARQLLLERHFVAERRALLNVLCRIAGGEQDSQQSWSREHMGQALDALLRHYPVYRSYVEDGVRHENDQHWFDVAMRAAQSEPEMHAAPYPALLRWLDAVLAGRSRDDIQTQEAIRRFQQLTPPLAAKALEDTVFYRYGRLLSRNEVGSDPEIFSLSAGAFHRANAQRARTSGRGLLATATHDHKRGEDVRARLAVLSEIPDEWGGLSHAWLDWSKGQGRVPASVRYMVLQMLVGAWPPELEKADKGGLTAFLERLAAWVEKALREGKQYSSWFEPDIEFEHACRDFLFALANDAIMLDQVEEFVRRIETPAIANGLVQSVLRLTCPGIPDLYQGTEFRDFSLVDPDNRRSVDYVARANALAQIEMSVADGSWGPGAWSDGRVKQALIARLLRLRHELPLAFQGGYTPLQVVGAPEERVIAFLRGSDVMVVAAVKCAAQVSAQRNGRPEISRDFWADGRVILPRQLSEGVADPYTTPTDRGSASGGGGNVVWKDALRHARTCAPFSTTDDGGKEIRLADVLAGFPVAVLYRAHG